MLHVRRRPQPASAPARNADPRVQPEGRREAAQHDARRVPHRGAAKGERAGVGVDDDGDARARGAAMQVSRPPAGVDERLRVVPVGQLWRDVAVPEGCCLLAARAHEPPVVGQQAPGDAVLQVAHADLDAAQAARAAVASFDADGP